MATTDIDELIVANFADLDHAAKHVHLVEERVHAQMDRVVESWADRNGWSGTFHYAKEVRLVPPGWGGDAGANFYVDYGPDDTGEGIGDEDYFDLTRLAGQGSGRICFWFGQKVISGKAWKEFAKRQAQASLPAGFVLSNSGNFYMPIGAFDLVQAFADGDFATALRPLETALDGLLRAKPQFDKLLKTMKTLA